MKLGIALGGGGAKGYAHIGILEVLQEEGIDFDIVTGTSIGALVGAAYAAGSLPSLSEKSRNIRLTDIPSLLGPTVSMSGLFSGKAALALLGEVLNYNDIEELPKRFAAVSVDLAKEELVIFDHGPIRNAVRASISIPALFTPIKEAGQFLVDGGLLEPVPIAICRKLGATKVLAVDLFGNPNAANLEDRSDQKALWPAGLSSALNYLESISSRLRLPQLLGGEKKEEQNGNPMDTPEHSAQPRTIIEVVESTLALSQKQLTAARLAEHPPDMLLQPPLRAVGLLDFHRGEPVIEIGRRCAREALPQIRALLKDLHA